MTTEPPEQPDDELPEQLRVRRAKLDRLRESGVELRHPTYREGYRAVLAGEGVRHP